MKITVVGLGFVGTANAIALAQDNTVIALDTDKVRIDNINSGISPVGDSSATDFMASKTLSLLGTISKEEAYKDPDIVLLCLPTDYNAETDRFDTRAIESVMEDIKEYCPSTTVLLKSTVPVGYTEHLRKATSFPEIYFSPEFLREGSALQDVLYPSRVIIGGYSKVLSTFSAALSRCTLGDTVTHLMPPTEAEAVKLFSNGYLAMRVAYFNELDTYAMHMGLDTSFITKGVCGDNRIGDFYNNPSFGYGGYCFIKDSQQLAANVGATPAALIPAIHRSNESRIKYIAGAIIDLNPCIVGIYRLVMKQGSDNFRNSATIRIAKILQDSGIEVIAYEPNIAGAPAIKGIGYVSLEELKGKASLIIANRDSTQLHDVRHKVFSRDVYGVDV